MEAAPESEKTFHQKVMDQAYDRWKQGTHYRGFLLSLGRLHRDAVVLGNLNYQVQNGGFSQWVENDYHEGAEYLVYALRAMDTELARKVLTMVEEALRLLIEDSDDYDGEDRALDVSDRLSNEFYALNGDFLKECSTYLECQATAA